MLLLEAAPAVAMAVAREGAEGPSLGRLAAAVLAVIPETAALAAATRGIMALLPQLAEEVVAAAAAAVLVSHKIALPVAAAAQDCMDLAATGRAEPATENTVGGLTAGLNARHRKMVVSDSSVCSAIRWTLMPPRSRVSTPWRASSGTGPFGLPLSRRRANAARIAPINASLP
jgi:hypothetical protein